MVSNTFVSIIIPSFNEENYIGSCLKSIFSLNYPSDCFEVIIIDNGSSDRTIQEAKRFDCQIKVVPGINVSALRNQGSKYAIGEVFFFLDADCVVNNDWVVNALEILKNIKIGILGCSWFRRPDNSSWIEEAWISPRMNKEGYVDWISSKNMIVRKKHFELLSGFDGSLSSCEDWDLCLRARSQLGLKTYSSSRVSILHCKTRRTTKEFFMKELWYGKDVLTVFSKQHINPFKCKPFLYGFLNLLLIMGILIGVFVKILLGYNSYFLLFITLILLMPFVLAIARFPGKKKVIPLAYLFLMYGVARAIGILVNFILLHKFEKR